MNIIRKNIDIPLSTCKGLVLLAAQKGTNTKNLMEQILVDYEKKINNPNSYNYKVLNPQSSKTKK